MKKLLELKALDTEVRELLHTVERPQGIYICIHMHYMHPTISIYMDNLVGEPKPTTQLMVCGVVFIVDIDIEIEIDEQIVDDIISQIEKVMQ